MPMCFYFDNLFTSFQLLAYLKDRGYDATGMVRDNRLPKNIPLTNKKVLQRNATRGSYEFTKDQEENIVVVRWKQQFSCYGHVYVVRRTATYKCWSIFID